MNEIKKVSVVMSTYNGESKGYLKDQLDSILNQTYPIYEIIIQDDGSSDKTFELLSDYAEKYPLIKLFRNEKNLGCGNSFVSAWNKATGDYIVVSDDDDVWLPTKIETLSNIIGDKILAIGQSKVIEGNNFDKYILGYKWGKRNPKKATIEKLMFYNCVGGGLEMMFNKKILSIINEIESENLIVPDYLLALIAYYNKSVAITEEITQYCRINPLSTSGKKFQYVEIDKKWRKIKGYKILYSNYCLIIGKKSSAIAHHFEKIYQVMKVLHKRTPTNTSKRLLSFVLSMKNQTFFSYVKSSLLCFSMRKDIFEVASKWNLKKYLNALFFVYRYWYDHRYDC